MTFASHCITNCTFSLTKCFRYVCTGRHHHILPSLGHTGLSSLQAKD